MLSEPPSVLVNGCMRLAVHGNFENLLWEQLQSKRQRWDELPSIEQNELAIIISATSVPDFQNQCKMLFTEIDGVFSNYCCAMKNATDNAIDGLFTQLQTGEHKTVHE